jgi:hypothetical protein
MSQTVPNYRWSVSEFVRAWEAGVFDHRVELIDGEVWPVVIGGWHGKTVGRVIALVTYQGVEVTTATLPSGDSLPDPDCWVQRPGAQPTGLLGTRVEVWAPDDVLLVVEVSDATMLADLTTKAQLYGAAGYPAYWAVTPDAVYEHTSPTSAGYRRRIEYRRGDRIPLGYAGVDIEVEALLGREV